MKDRIVEAVAKALRLRDFKEKKMDFAYWDCLDEDQKDGYRKEAKKLIACLEEKGIEVVVI